MQRLCGIATPTFAGFAMTSPDCHVCGTGKGLDNDAARAYNEWVCKAKVLDRVKPMADNIKAGADPAESAEFYKVSILLDFYGQLLTARQYEILDLYYNNDYSLAEIAEELGISRQGVHDSIRKGRAALEAYEERLGLAARFREQEEKMKRALSFLKKVESEVPEAAGNKSFRKAVKALERVMDSL